MVCFGDVAWRMIGKPVQQLLRTSTGPNTYTADITKLVSLMFTFAVTMTHQSYYKAQKTYNVASLVTSHGQVVPVPNNPGHAESGESSDKTSGEDASVLPATGTPNSTPTSSTLLSTPPPTLGTVETPATKKHQRVDSSKSNKHPSCRRRILEEDPDTETTAIEISGSSGAADKLQADEDGSSSEEHSSAQESG